MHENKTLFNCRLKAPSVKLGCRSAVGRVQGCWAGWVEGSQTQRYCRCSWQ